MRPTRSTAAAALTPLLLVAGPIHGDVLILDNGDRISGTFIEQDTDTLTYRPDYGNAELSIDWNRVNGLMTDSVVRVVLEDDTEIAGQAVEAEPGRLHILPGDQRAPITIPVDQVRAVTGPHTPSRDPVHTTGNINVGGTFTRGDTRTHALNANGVFEARTDYNRFRFNGEVNQAEEGEDVFRDNISGTTRYDHFISERIYVNSNLSPGRDRFRDIRLRFAAGAGLGYQFFDTPRRSLSAELGASYLRQDHYEAENESSPAARWAVDYQEHLFTGVQLFHAQEGLMNLPDSREFLVTTQTGVRFPLIGGITGTTQINVDYENVPSAELHHTDVAYLLTAGYGW